MTEKNKQTKSERGKLFQLFTKPSKSQSWINLISYAILSFMLLFFLLAGLESSFDTVEDFFKSANYEIWLIFIFILIPIGLAMFAFAISYKFEKIGLKLFKFSIAGIIGSILGLGLYAILDTSSVLSFQHGTLIGSFIILAFSLILGTISLFFPLNTKNE
ncbi:MAG: hypothetical protein ACTSPO_12395 [Candidatus Heimdallarchaeaceae archaeon]